MRRVSARAPTSSPGTPLGLGIGWRPEIALYVERRASARGDLGFVEVLAESVDARRGVPAPLEQLRERGVRVVPHGVSLSLGGAQPVDRARVDALARLARAVDAPLVSEHVAFVRGGGVEAGHLLPVPRTRESLRIVVENVRATQALLPAPLALENIATLFEWPGAEMSEAEFLGELLDRTGALLLLDIANVYANVRNLAPGSPDPLAGLPLDRIAYVHVGGGVEHGGVYHDTHAHATPAPVLDLLRALCGRASPPGVLLERDDHFPPDAELDAELDAIAAACGRSIRPPASPANAVGR
jgi:uncharacterized protein